MHKRLYAYMTTDLVVIGLFLAIGLSNRSLSPHQLLAEFWPWYTAGTIMLLAVGWLAAQEKNR